MVASFNGQYTLSPQEQATKFPSGTYGGGQNPNSPMSGPNPQNGTNPMTGWAATQKFTPGMLDSIFENPWVILPRIFQGMTPSSPGYQALRDLGGDPLALFQIMHGANNLIQGGAPEFANFARDVYANQGTPGGRAFDAPEMLRSIFNAKTTGPRGEGGAPTPAQTSLGQLLGTGDPAQQARTLYNLIRDVAGVSMNPLSGQSYEAAMLQMMDAYQNQALSSPAGKVASPNAFVRQNAPWMAGMF